MNDITYHQRNRKKRKESTRKSIKYNLSSTPSNGHNNRNYKNNQNIMKKESIRNLWEEFISKYKEYHLSDEEEWKYNLTRAKQYAKQYIDTNIKDEQLEKWISNQVKNYKNKQWIMKKESIRNLWEEFLNDVKEYFYNSNY